MHTNLKSVSVWGLVFGAVLAWFASTIVSTAQTQPILLRIEVVNATGTPEAEYQLARSDLAAFPARTFETKTNWTAGVQKFTGVSLFTVIESLNVEANTVELIAQNDYSVSIKGSEITADGAMIAYLRNDKPMTLRDKGPLWVVYDYDSNPKFQTETIYTRSIWQLDRMIISR